MVNISNDPIEPCPAQYNHKAVRNPTFKKCVRDQCLFLDTLSVNCLKLFNDFKAKYKDYS